LLPNFDENFPPGGEYMACPLPPFACFGPRLSSDFPLEKVMGAWRLAGGGDESASSIFSVAATLMALRCFGVTQLSRTTDLNEGGEWKRSRINVWMFEVVFNPMIFNLSSSVFGSDGFLSLPLMSSCSFLM
jgi:hypothetical protein